MPKKRQKRVIVKTLSATSFLVGIGLASVFWASGNTAMLYTGIAAIGLTIYLAVRG